MVPSGTWWWEYCMELIPQSLRMERQGQARHTPWLVSVGEGWMVGWCVGRAAGVGGKLGRGLIGWSVGVWKEQRRTQQAELAGFE